MSRRRIGITALLAGLTVAVVYGGVLFANKDTYILRAELKQAQGLIKGYSVRVDGAQVGKIESLELNERDHVVAEMRLDKSAPPVGRGATVTVRTLDLFGERFADLEAGDARRPVPSGTTIPPERTFVSVEIDDVFNTFDMSTREALATFLDEQGTAFVGRGNDIAAVLQALPPSLDKTGKLVADLSRDNRALGRLIEESDRVVGRVARERGDLGRLVDNAGTTFDTLASRRRDLGETVERAPATLASARRALAALEGAAIPLAPAARGLRATAPQLTATLRELPGFADAARPTLRTLREVSPSLGTLGRQGTPVVRRLRPLTSELSEFAEAFTPSSRILSEGWPEQLALMEGWARSTQVRDAASQVFRFGLAGFDDDEAARASLTRLGVLPGEGTTGAGEKESSKSASRRRAKSRSSERSSERQPPKVRSGKRSVRRLGDRTRAPKPELRRPSAPRRSRNRSMEPVLDYLLGP